MLVEEAYFIQSVSTSYIITRMIHRVTQKLRRKEWLRFSTGIQEDEKKSHFFIICFVERQGNYQPTHKRY